MRIYHDFTLSSDNNKCLVLLCKAFCSNDDLDLCDAQKAGIAYTENTIYLKDNLTKFCRLIGQYKQQPWYHLAFQSYG